MLFSIPLMECDEKIVSYDVESLLTNIPIKQTTNFIIEQIYVPKKLKPIYWKLIFKRFLVKF